MLPLSTLSGLNSVSHCVYVCSVRAVYFLALLQKVHFHSGSFVLPSSLCFLLFSIFSIIQECSLLFEIALYIVQIHRHFHRVVIITTCDCVLCARCEILCFLQSLNFQIELPRHFIIRLRASSLLLKSNVAPLFSVNIHHI